VQTSTQRCLRIGPYTYRIGTTLPAVERGLAALYSDFPRVADDAFIDFDVGIRRARALPWRSSQAIFQFDRRDQFAATDIGPAFATLEWGMNWCIAVHCNVYLKLHAAVIANAHGAVVMPGVPGAGKSTLCALMAMQGWRVLSDEYALITRGQAVVTPVYRPISLKNESITLLRRLCPDAVFGPVIRDTHKGTIAHLKADAHPATFDPKPLPVRALVFPHFTREAPQRLTRASRTRSFLTAAYHAFNYSLLGEEGFHAMRTLVEATPCLSLQYRDVDWALRAFERIGEETAAS
jgi:HprK-related kinase A